MGASPDEEPTVQLARGRFVRRRWARRLRSLRWPLAALAACGAVGALVWLVFFSSVLAVAGVVVEGTAVLSTEQVREAARVRTDVPLATADLDAVSARVEVLAPVESVQVSRAWPDRVRIRVTERESVAVVEREGTFRGVDADGVVFRTYPARPADLPLVQMAAATSSDALAEAAGVVEALPAAVADKVEYLDVRSVDAISLLLEDGSTVRWGSAEDSGSKAAVLAVLLRSPARAYDVSVPARPTLQP